jgi:hypothetical protein
MQIFICCLHRRLQPAKSKTFAVIQIHFFDALINPKIIQPNRRFTSEKLVIRFDDGLRPNNADQCMGLRLRAWHIG